MSTTQLTQRKKEQITPDMKKGDEGRKPIEKQEVIQSTSEATSNDSTSKKPIISSPSESEPDEEDQPLTCGWPAFLTGPIATSSFYARFSLDLRGLAIFRIGLGLLYTWDIIRRYQEFDIFYQAAGGVLPADQVEKPYPYHYSLLLLSGLDPSMQDLISHMVFNLAFLGGVGLIVGYQTRVSSWLSFILMLSIQNRNPDICNKGDMLFRVMMLWSGFLPLAARWSLDARKRTIIDSRIPPSSSSAARGIPHAYLSFGTIGYMFQIFLMYFFNGLLKCLGREWYPDGSATFIALHGRDVVTHVGVAAVAGLSYEFLRWCTFGVLFLELFGPFLFFARSQWIRVIVSAAFASMHLGIMVSMRLGIFQWICLTCLIPFLPESVWNWFEMMLEQSRQEWKQSGSSRLHLWWLVEQLSSSSATEAAKQPKQQRQWDLRPSKLASSIAASLLAFIVIWNFSVYPLATDLFRPLELLQTKPLLHSLGYVSGIHQWWGMYAPSPYRTSSWLLARGYLSDRDYYVDIKSSLESGRITPVSWTKPHAPNLIMDQFPSARWGKYLLSLGQSSRKQQAYVKWLCQQWQHAMETEPSSSTTVRSILQLYLPAFALPSPSPAFHGINSPAPVLSEIDLYYLMIDTKLPSEKKSPTQEEETKWRWLGRYQC